MSFRVHMPPLVFAEFFRFALTSLRNFRRRDRRDLQALARLGEWRMPQLRWRYGLAVLRLHSRSHRRLLTIKFRATSGAGRTQKSLQRSIWFATLAHFRLRSSPSTVAG